MCIHRSIYICSQCLISCISNILMHIKAKNTKSNSCGKGSKFYKHNHDCDRKALTLLFYISVYSNFGLITVTQSPIRIQSKKGNLQVNSSFKYKATGRLRMIYYNLDTTDCQKQKFQKQPREVF